MRAPARRRARRRSPGRAARRRTTRTCRRPSAPRRSTRSQPLAFSSGTNFFACSTSPGNSILPSTLALSQIAMPGLVRPRTPTFRVRALRPVPILKRLDDVRPERRALGRRVDRVRAEEREVELVLEGAQRVEAVVELVVAERGGVVPDLVHRPCHRVDRAVGDRVDLGVVVGQRRALDGVAGVEGEDRLAPALLAHRLDQRGHLGQPDVVVGGVVELGVLEVVPVEDVAVQVGGAEHGQPHPLAALAADRDRVPRRRPVGE